MKTKGIVLLLLTTFLLVTLIPSAYATPFWAYAAYTTTTTNIRTGPGTEYAIITTLSKYTEVTVTGESGSWFFVRTKNGITGYIRKDLLAKGTEEAYVGEYSVPYKAQTSCKVYLRKGPGTHYDIIELLSPGKSVEVIGEAVEWVHVRVGMQTGYIYKKYVIPVNANPTVAPAKPEKPSSTHDYRTTTKVYFRKGAGTEYEKIALLKKGEIVTVLGYLGDWAVVFRQGQLGYVYSKYLELIK